MKKYFCIMCGYETNKNKKHYEHLDCFENHHFIIRSFKTRFLDFILTVPIEIWFRLVGGWLIYFIFKNHFDWDFNLIESILIGVGMGLLMVGGG